jgi:GDP-D-mannose 3', 5'-epimerase
VAGAGGFIGGHLVEALLADGIPVRAVDLKPPEAWCQRFGAAENLTADLRSADACEAVLEGTHEVYNLAADMGGIGFIENNRALCMLSVLINAHLLQAAVLHGVERFFFASSACVYPLGKQRSHDNPGLRESDVMPADPEGGYGWEKLFSERMCHHFMEDFGLQTRVARYHNVYGPWGAWTGGREKAPAAICRKVAEAERSGRHEIEVWGDGRQTRSFMYVEDCVEGTRRLMRSDVREPVNLGSAEMVKVERLVELIEAIAGLEVTRRYNPDAPQGVRGRSSDNTLIRHHLGWEPSTALQDGLAHTYAWVHEQVAALRAAG